MKASVNDSRQLNGSGSLRATLPATIVSSAIAPQGSRPRSIPRWAVLTTPATRRAAPRSATAAM